MLFVPYGRTTDILYGAAGALIFSVYLVIDTQVGAKTHSFSYKLYIIIDDDGG